MGFQEEKYNIDNMKSNISRLGVMLSSHYDIDNRSQRQALWCEVFSTNHL